MGGKEETIICSAIWNKKGQKMIHGPINIVEGYVVAGFRHCNCFETLKYTDKDIDHTKLVQGFLTSNNRFVNRETALILVLNSGQNTRVTKLELERKWQLHSEDLY